MLEKKREVITIELYRLSDRVVASIKRNGRDKLYHHVTASSRQRLAFYVFMQSKKFRIYPFVTDIVGWTADSN